MEGRAAMAMSRSDSDLAAIYDAMACGVVVRNAAGSVVFANRDVTSGTSIASTMIARRPLSTNIAPSSRATKPALSVAAL